MSTTAPTARSEAGQLEVRHRRDPIEKTYLAMLILFTGLLMIPFLTGLFYTFTNFKG